MGRVTLYHVPPSFYSQIARLVLVEKGVAFEAKLAAAGPPLFETYAPWYMRLNPNGTVPLMVHGDTAIPDSREILTYVDAEFEGPELTPSDADERARMEARLEDMYAISVREISYGSERLAKVGARGNMARIKNLRRRSARHPDLREVYEAKLRDIQGFAAHAQDPSHINASRDALSATLDELDASLTHRPFLAGSSYSLADVAWVVGVARFQMIGLEPLAGRTELASWYQRMRERPSFVAANVWERVDLVAMLGMLTRKLGPYALGIMLVVAVLIWALRWGLSSM